jgi:hypothetical protein
MYPCRFAMAFRQIKNPLVTMSGQNSFAPMLIFPAYAGWIWHLDIETRRFNRLP